MLINLYMLVASCKALSYHGSSGASRRVLRGQQAATILAGIVVVVDVPVGLHPNTIFE